METARETVMKKYALGSEGRREGRADRPTSVSRTASQCRDANIFQLPVGPGLFSLCTIAGVLPAARPSSSEPSAELAAFEGKTVVPEADDAILPAARKIYAFFLFNIRRVEGLL